MRFSFPTYDFSFAYIYFIKIHCICIFILVILKHLNSFLWWIKIHCSFYYSGSIKFAFKFHYTCSSKRYKVYLIFYIKASKSFFCSKYFTLIHNYICVLSNSEYFKVVMDDVRISKIPQDEPFVVLKERNLIKTLKKKM